MTKSNRPTGYVVKISRYGAYYPAVRWCNLLREARSEAARYPDGVATVHRCYGTGDEQSVGQAI